MNVNQRLEGFQLPTQPNTSDSKQKMFIILKP